MRDESESPTKNWSRKKRALVKLATVASALVIALLIAEAGLRIIGYTYPIFYTPDEQRGYALSPGATGWYRKEGASFVRVSSAGLRDREHETGKPSGTLRIAVLGDSYAEALQVAQEEAFWAVMERELQGCYAGQRVEVINFGVSGYGTAQELLTLREHVWRYAPDIVLLAVTTNNDITDNSRQLKKTDEIPYFTLRDGQLALDDSFRETRAFRLRNSAANRAGRWLRDQLRVVQAIHEAHGAIKNFIATRRARRSAAARTQAPAAQQATAQPATGGDLKLEDVGTDNLIYREPQDEVWREAWRVTEKLLVTMRDEVEGRGAEFLVVTLSNGVQVHPDASAREQFARRVGADDLFYPDLRIKALGEREGFKVLTLAPELRRYAEQNRVFLHGFGADIGNGHWNQTGHRVAGEILAHQLCQREAR